MSRKASPVLDSLRANRLAVAQFASALADIRERISAKSDDLADLAHVMPSDEEIEKRAEALVQRLAAAFVRDVSHPLLAGPEATFSLEEAAGHLGRLGILSLVSDEFAPQIVQVPAPNSAMAVFAAIDPKGTAKFLASTVAKAVSEGGARTADAGKIAAERASLESEILRLCVEEELMLREAESLGVGTVATRRADAPPDVLLARTAEIESFLNSGVV